MKAEFYYDKRKYTSSISEVEGTKELRIKNDRGLVLAVKQGQTTGLLGKTRKDAQCVDVSQPRFYNTIKAAISAIQLAENSQELQQKDTIIFDLKTIIEQKDKQIEILNQQLLILKQENKRLSHQRQQQLEQLQLDLQKREKDIQRGQQLITQLQATISQSPPPLDRNKLKTQIKQKIGEVAWSSLAKLSQKELCDSSWQYQLINSESFTASITDYSGAALGLCLVAEREIIRPFFKYFYQFLVKNNTYARFFEVGGVAIKARGKYTLGCLPVLLSWQWEALRREALELTSQPVESRMYQTVFFGNKVSRSDRKLVNNFLKQWNHPLSKWLAKGEMAAAAIDEIRQFRNRVTHHENILYLWQFERLRTIIIGGKNERGMLREIYQ